jgi:hypothetical protein
MYTDTKLMRLEFLLFRLICVQNKVINLILLPVPSVDPIMNNGWPDLFVSVSPRSYGPNKQFLKFGLVGSIPFNLPQTRSSTPHTPTLWLWLHGQRGVWLMWACPEVSARARAGGGTENRPRSSGPRPPAPPTPPVSAEASTRSVYMNIA